MREEGYIKLWRKIWNNPYMRRPAYLSVFVCMLMEAEHGMIKDGGKWRKKTDEEMRRIVFEGKDIKLEAGQFTAGLNQIAKWSGVPRGTVKRIVDVLENETMIETVRGNKFTLYKVKNWDKYQNNETEDETLMKLKRNSNETLVKTPKECKDYKERKECKKYINADAFDFMFSEYERLSHRKIESKNPRRLAAINRALNDFPKESIIEAWAAMSLDRFLRGDNQSQKDYFTFEYACRVEKIEDYLHRYKQLA
jgi:DNA-binding transcriptional regulator YhcF (GntR family)